MPLPFYSKLPQLLHMASYRRRMEANKPNIVIITFQCILKWRGGDHLRSTWIQLYKLYGQDGFVINKITCPSLLREIKC